MSKVTGLQVQDYSFNICIRYLTSRENTYFKISQRGIDVYTSPNQVGSNLNWPNVFVKLNNSLPLIFSVYQTKLNTSQNNVPAVPINTKKESQTKNSINSYSSPCSYNNFSSSINNNKSDVTRLVGKLETGVINILESKTSLHEMKNIYDDRNFNVYVLVKNMNNNCATEASTDTAKASYLSVIND